MMQLTEMSLKSSAVLAAVVCVTGRKEENQDAGGHNAGFD